MLLQEIVEKLDRELNRLYRLREIVAGLKQTAPEVLALAESEQAEVSPSASEPKRVPSRTRRGFGKSRLVGRSHAESPKPQTALTGSIPAGPVVVPAAVVAERNATRKTAKPAEPPAVEGTLGAMIRAALHQGRAV